MDFVQNGGSSVTAGGCLGVGEWVEKGIAKRKRVAMGYQDKKRGVREIL